MGINCNVTEGNLSAPVSTCKNDSRTCLAGDCFEYKCGCIKKALDAEAIAPYVRVWICTEDKVQKVLTVGNRSNPEFKHRAVISSFQYGQDNGCGATIEIVDEEGGAFQKFFDKLLTRMKDVNERYIVKCQWGWVGSRCSRNDEGPLKSSCEHTLLLKKVSIKFDVVYKFVLECTDLIQIGLMTKNEKVYGTDKKPMELKQAIIQACKDNVPSCDVKFWRRLPDGSIQDWKFFPNDETIKAVWQCNQQNILGFVQRWIRPFYTDREKGIVLRWLDTAPGCKPVLVLWEDGNPACNEVNQCIDNRHIGTYIVNGGECSPVIEFNPQINWNFFVAAQAGGFAAKSTGRLPKQHEKKDGGKDCDLGSPEEEGINTGSITYNVEDSNAQRIWGKQATDQILKGDKLNTRANGTHESIRGELRIQGDPELDNPLLLAFARASIVVINPFHLGERGESVGCPEWFHSGADSVGGGGGIAIANSACNTILSNKCWIIRGVSHEIRLGAYTTTLNCFLPAGGSTINEKQPLGGCPGGYKMPN